MESLALRRAIAEVGNWLANTAPPWVAYRALVACHLVALNKRPGVRPIGIGEVFLRLLAKCVLALCGSVAKLACGDKNVCSGLLMGIEGAVHAIRNKWVSRCLPDAHPHADPHPPP